MAVHTTFTLEQLLIQLTARWEDVPFWTREDAVLSLQEALSWWNLLTGTWRTTVTVDLTALNWDYPLPASLVYGARLSTAAGPLYPSTLWDLDYGKPNWRNETVASGGSVPTRPTLWAPVDPQWVVIWPAPTAFTADGLTVTGVAATPTLADESSTVDFSEKALHAVLGCALHLAAFDEGGARFAATQPFWDDFLAAAAEQNSQLKASAFYRRYFGLDDRRAFRRTKGLTTRLDRVAGRVQASEEVR